MKKGKVVAKPKEDILKKSTVTDKSPGVGSELKGKFDPNAMARFASKHFNEGTVKF